ncbi:MAG: cytochrome P450 [Thermoleophilaceae bacterium]
MATPAAHIELDRIDLSDLHLYADGPPWGLFARLRQAAPVHWNQLPDAPGFWSLTRHADIRAANLDWETYSSGLGGVFLREDQVLPWEAAQLAIINQDPPRHTKLRDIVQKVFTPRVIREREAHICELTTELIDGLIERGECDFVQDFARNLPLTVIAEMGGVPAADHQQIIQWTEPMSAFDDPRFSTSLDHRVQALGELSQYLLALVADRRENPREDLISHLTRAEVDGEGLSDLEIVIFFAFLMDAGNQTTRNTTAGAMLALMEHPEERRKLIEDPSLIGDAVEEFLRWHSAILQMRRTATRDVELHGVRIEEGQKVVLWYASGNRDPDVFSEPDRFNVTRSDAGKHQAFGGGGRHFCLGNQLARLELRVIFEELLRRIPDMELAGPVDRMRSNFFHGIVGMPVTFTPGKRS